MDALQTPWCGWRTVGPGYAARIDLEMSGSNGDSCIPEMPNGLLVDTGAGKIPAT